MTNTWYYGPSHSGKSAQAFAGYGPAFFVYDGSWDGLLPTHTHIVLDDLTPALLSHRDLCRLADVHPMFVRTRDRRVEMGTRTVIVTCLAPPHLAYEGTDDFGEPAAKQLKNRFTVVRCGAQESPSNASATCDSDSSWIDDS